MHVLTESEKKTQIIEETHSGQDHRSIRRLTEKRQKEVGKKEVGKAVFTDDGW